MKRYKIGNKAESRSGLGLKGASLRGAAIALALITTACGASPQAQLKTDPEAADPAVPSADSGTATSDDFVSSLPQAPQPSDPSGLGLSAKYRGDAQSAKAPEAKKVRAPRLVTAGRPNPFRSVHQPQVEVTYPEAAEPAALPETPLAEAAPVQSAPQSVVMPALPEVPAIAFGTPPPPMVLPVPAVPPLAVPASLPTLPTLPAMAPPAPPAPASPTAIAEAIEIRGLVQVGDRFNVIIKDPAATTSRTVQVGDIIGGGRVKLSRINAPESREPQVVLEQDGVEVIRAIGV